MIQRHLREELLRQVEEFPVVTVIGPRQAGKTTLVQEELAGWGYVSLEDPDTRRLAERDPRALLGRLGRRVIVDEVQRVPELLSYLQGKVDETGEAGQYVLTGSHQLQLREAIGQSLAGRTGILRLLPLSLGELAASGKGMGRFEEAIHRGFLPRLHVAGQRPQAAYSAYYQTYVERDVRLLIHLKDEMLFDKFMRLLAGRVGQLVDFASLAGDVGVDAKTIRNWISILEASFLVFRLPPYFENFGKRLIKSPKLYFTDTGLLCYLLGIETEEQVLRDPLVGSLFENLVVLECLKARYHQGKEAGLYFFRDSNGNEIDLLQAAGRSLHGIEIKSASTFHESFKKSLKHFHERIAPLQARTIVYNGEPLDFSDGVSAVRFDRIAERVG